jgi:hypothetical protein
VKKKLRFCAFFRPVFALGMGEQFYFLFLFLFSSWVEDQKLAMVNWLEDRNNLNLITGSATKGIVIAGKQFEKRMMLIHPWLQR